MTAKIDPKLIKELAKSVKTEKDLASLSKQLLKMTVETALNTELDEHLGYARFCRIVAQHVRICT